MHRHKARAVCIEGVRGSMYRGGAGQYVSRGCVFGGGGITRGVVRIIVSNKLQYVASVGSG